MSGYAAEIERIKKILKANPRGMTIINLSKELNISRNSAAKYLDILLVSGQVEMESVGPAKIYFLSHRIPSSTLINYSSDHVLVIDDQLKVTQINDVFLDLIGVKREDAIGKDIDDTLFFFSTSPDILTKIKEAVEGSEYNGNIDFSIAENIFHFKIKILPSALDSGIPGVSIVMSDVTEEKDMQQRLNKYHRLLDELTKENNVIPETISDDQQAGITYLKEKNNESHRKDAKNQAMLDAMPDLIFSIRRDGTFLDYVAPSDKHLFAPTSEFLGKKVNEVMPDKLSEQIMLCIGQALQTNEIQTIQYELPINDNILHYEARIVTSGKDEVMTIATDITERKKAENELKQLNEQLRRKLEIEQILLNITYLFVPSANIDTTILSALEMIGELCGASRAYIFMFHQNGTVMDNKYEWCSEGVKTQKDELQDLPVKMYPWWMNKLHNGEYIHIKDVSALPEEASAEKEILELQNIRSLIVLPLYIKNELTGFIGLDNGLNTGDWQEQEIDILRMASYVIGTGIEREQMETSLRESEVRVKKKLSAILEPEEDIEELELADIIDTEYFQSLMEDYNRLTGHLVSIGDLHGNPLVAVGWQDICTKFHRVHPETCAYCTESDLHLCKNLSLGNYELYQCKNGLWDAITPIFVEGQHLGNIYYGQFFLDDEEVPYDKFRLQARKYGFDEEKYMEALDRVPRVSREKVDTIMSFYIQLTNLISRLSYSNIKLARTVHERDNLLNSLHESEQLFRSLFEKAGVGVVQGGPDGYFMRVNEHFAEMLGYSVDELSEMNFRDITHPDDLDLDEQYVKKCVEGTINSYEIEKRFIHKQGHIIWAKLYVKVITDDENIGRYVLGVIVDISEKRKNAGE